MAGTVLMEKSCINDLQYVELFQVKPWLELLSHSNKALEFLVVFEDTRVKWGFWAFLLFFFIITRCKMDKWKTQIGYF